MRNGSFFSQPPPPESMRVSPPGLAIAQIEPSGVSPSQRTLSPASPSLRVQVRAGGCPPSRVKPLLVATHSAPFRSRRMFQTKFEANPSALVQLSQSPYPRQRATPAPISPIQSEPRSEE